MMRGVYGALCCAAIFAFSAQTPASAPLRQLVFNFTVVYTTTGEVHDSGFSGFGGGGGSGLVTVHGSDGREGTLTVDILAAANDGGLVVRAQEHTKEIQNDRPPVTCAIYGDARVICGDRADLSDAMTLVLSHLGRNFYDPSIVDDKGRWERRAQYSNFSVHTTFTMPKKEDAGPSMIYEHREVRSLDGTSSNSDEDVRVDYNIAMSVPAALSSELTPDSRGALYTRSKIDMTLAKDSFAKP